MNMTCHIPVPYFEKALYEMAEKDVTAESIKALADKVEYDIQGGLSPRPLLSVPHILSDEASCYYHGYVSIFICFMLYDVVTTVSLYADLTEYTQLSNCRFLLI